MQHLVGEFKYWPLLQKNLAPKHECQNKILFAFWISYFCGINHFWGRSIAVWQPKLVATVYVRSFYALHPSCLVAYRGFSGDMTKLRRNSSDEDYFPDSDISSCESLEVSIGTSCRFCTEAKSVLEEQNQTLKSLDKKFSAIMCVFGILFLWFLSCLPLPFKNWLKTIGKMKTLLVTWTDQQNLS